MQDKSIAPHATTKEHNDTLDTIEQMIDKHGLSVFLNIVAEVASEKADHIRTQWQDENLAGAWDSAAENVLRVSVKFARVLG